MKWRALRRQRLLNCWLFRGGSIFSGVKLPQTQPANPSWKVEERVVCYEDDHLRVVRETVRTPTAGQGRKWTTAHRKPAVVVAAMTEDERLVLIRQERIPVRALIWEMPAGQIDEENPGRAEIEATALRELEEETGYRLAANGRLIELGTFYASPGFTDELEHLFLARPVELTGKKDEGEAIADCAVFSAEEIRGMIASNEIRDANTLACFARLVARELLSLPSKDC